MIKNVQMNWNSELIITFKINYYFNNLNAIVKFLVMDWVISTDQPFVSFIDNKNKIKKET